jgi:hypothetical protein
VFRFGLALAILWATSAFAAEPSAAELSRSIRAAGLDPDECYRVRDLRFQKEDIKIYFNDGYLIFSKPIAGERRAAVFTADVEGGDGEVLLLPPYRGERKSLSLFTQSANLDEHFRAALMIFSGGSTGILLDRILKEEAGKKAPEMGAILAERWSPVLTNVQSSFEIRLIEDLMVPPPEGGLMFFALSGKQTGNFDMLYDPRSREQIAAGQLAEHNGRLSYNIWTSFAARSARNSPPKPPAPWFTLSNFRISATFDQELSMKAVTRVRVRVGPNNLRLFPFEISQAMHVTSVKIDGVPAELFFQESVRGRALRGTDNDIFLAISPAALAAGSEHEFEFEHEGNVVTSAGNRVYFVNARATWYPHAGENFATYDLTFHYPRRLTMVAAGDMQEDGIENDFRFTRWKTPTPIRMAGFNLGEYEKVSASAGGVKVDVYGNRRVEVGLQPKMPTSPIVLPPSIQRQNDPSRIPVPTPVPSPDPSVRLRAVAADISASMEFFSSRFGPPALKTLTVAPIPGPFGQGFPGLVYLSTISYLEPSQLPAGLRDSSHQLFFSDLMEAHEVAHQWWGNVVVASAYQDEWLQEALASYSALLWLEKKKGPKAVEGVLEGYREHLTQKDAQGHSIESAGPIVWGTRLDSTGVPDAWRTITYEKGAWIFHMLRRRLGDERFLKMLAELRKRYEFHPVSTDDVRKLAKEFVPPKTSAAAMETFFENWVYATGVPALKLKYSVTGAAPNLKVSGTVTQSGVDDDFTIDAPVEIQFAKGAPQTIWVRTTNEAVPFSTTVKIAPQRVVLAEGILAKK